MSSRKLKNTRPGYLIRSWTAVLTLGLTTGGVLVGKTHEAITGTPYDNTKAPHETPYKAEPPTGGHKNLADAATNPIGNLIQVQTVRMYPSPDYSLV